MLLDRELDGTRLAEIVSVLAADPERRRAMAGSARSLARPGAAASIADLAEELIEGESRVRNGRR